MRSSMDRWDCKLSYPLLQIVHKLYSEVILLGDVQLLAYQFQ